MATTCSGWRCARSAATTKRCAPSSPGSARRREWHDLFVLKSDILRDKKLPVDAMAAAKEAVRLDPDDPDTHTAVALSAAALNDHTLAVVALRRALALDPDSADLHRLLGDRLLDLTNHEQAIVEYHHALRLEPNDAYALNNLGCALQAQGRLEEAALAYKSAVLLDPTMKEAKQNTHDTVRGIARGASVLGVSGCSPSSSSCGGSCSSRDAYCSTRRSGSAPGRWWPAASRSTSSAGGWRLRRLADKDPQLLAIYERLKADRKSGRI